MYLISADISFRAFLGEPTGPTTRADFVAGASARGNNKKSKLYGPDDLHITNHFVNRIGCAGG